jgi:hypothetical protein
MEKVLVEFEVEVVEAETAELLAYHKNYRT